MRLPKLSIILLLFASVTSAAFADVGLLLEQPYGKFGGLSPTGHAAIYLSRVCAESPVILRRCRPGESGVVISRYSGIGKYDWIAIPLMPYLYAVSEPQEIPASIDAATEMRLRDRYRRTHLENLVPDALHGKTPAGEWTELVGGAYDRKIYIFEIETTAVQDDRLIAELNTRPNKSRFNYFFRNCANFAEFVLNFYYPHAVHRSFTADLGLVTPKQIAKSLMSYTRHHRDLQLSVFAISQVPGKIHRSSKICGVVEALLRQKQYAIPLVIWHPFFTAALVGTYLARGRFNPEHDSVVLNRNTEVEALLRDTTPGLNQEAQSSHIERAAVNPADHPSHEKCIGESCDIPAIDVLSQNTNARPEEPPAQQTN